MASRRCFWMVKSGGDAGKGAGEPVRASIRHPSIPWMPWMPLPPTPCRLSGARSDRWKECGNIA